MDGKKQACAPKTQKFAKKAFEAEDKTVIRWLGNSGALVNSRGTIVMVDPLLKGFDMPLLIDMPIEISEVPKVDAILITHCDNDHFSRITCKELQPVCKNFHAPHHVASLMDEIGIQGQGHNIHESFEVGNIRVTLTPVDHAWQNAYPKYKTREFKMEDYCGFWIDTPDGSIWAVGDSRLLEEQLKMPVPDAMLFDFSDSSWHIGMEGAIKMANSYPDTKLILWHWGCVDAPNMKEFNGDPAELAEKIVNPERIVVLAPGEEYELRKLQK
ncbi:MBL fold metallo-hydrolase [Clostridium sp.]|uniref:MBL fold metallo-hydrolase n=1 Tax=Clostridium sp. TaxID=1506 RepID=UPI002847043C|nr:MBL fold metallo-hydrolase [Clostridium sp.]MDR3594374.1 MBL fold metallo-hydrolase [Clostridium sp.]